MNTVLKIGHVDLGTTHPLRFVKTEQEMGYLPYGIYDDGRIIEHKALLQFAAEHDLIVFDSLEQMAEEVDIAMIHSVNWDMHLDRTRLFAAKGKGVYIDKPIVGNPAHMKEMLSLVKRGARITGGSMIYYSAALDQFCKNPEEDGPIRTIFAGAPRDEFFYGIHAITMVCVAFGFDIAVVRFLGNCGPKLYEMTWTDGRKAVFSLGDTGTQFPFHMTAVADGGARHYSHLGAPVLKEMLTQVIPYLSKQCEIGKVPPLQQLFQCEQAVLAAKVSEAQGGEPVSLSEIEDFSIPGDLFEQSYKEEYRKYQATVL